MCLRDECALHLPERQTHCLVEMALNLLVCCRNSLTSVSQRLICSVSIENSILSTCSRPSVERQRSCNSERISLKPIFCSKLLGYIIFACKIVVKVHLLLVYFEKQSYYISFKKHSYVSLFIVVFVSLRSKSRCLNILF